MKNFKENDYKTHIRILYFLILLLFLLVLVQPFIFIYLLQHSNIRMATPVSEEGNMKSRKTYDEDAIINENTIVHRVKKREISSETGKQCQGGCSLTPNPSVKNHGTINIKGSWNIKKSDLLEYCFTADDFCQRNRKKTKNEQKNNSVEENQQETKTKNCILQNITEDETLEYQDISFDYTNFVRSALINIEEDPKDNYKIIFQQWGRAPMKEFRLNEKEEVKILKEFKLPKQMSTSGIIESQ
ncbi:putative uncharacterized protein DDB_G0270496 [Centruroides vittatus]|uniref:putative uncharacterized protein DDB_G0270496 n=1 Tax=Centruroides vittatus TaxID=120091 RepID=UPI003510971F